MGLVTDCIGGKGNASGHVCPSVSLFPLCFEPTNLFCLYMGGIESQGHRSLSKVSVEMYVLPYANIN